jgi:hypothetical protein
MKKSILLLCAICAFVANSFAQTTYDVFTYTEPIGYKKETEKDYISYTKSDAKTGTYCIISLYAQNPSTGNLVKDFDSDWATLVKPLGVAAAPQKDNGDEITGWKTYTGAANFEFNGGTSMALLTTAKKDNINAAVLIVTNAQSFITTDVDVFFDKLKLGVPKIVVKINNTDTTKTVKKANDTIQTKILNKEILGEWYLSDGNAKITLLFGASGRYDRGSLVDRRITRNLVETTTFLGAGSYTLKGTNLTLTPKSGVSETYQFRIAYVKNSENKVNKILYLVRPISGGQLYESEYYFVK